MPLTQIHHALRQNRLAMVGPAKSILMEYEDDDSDDLQVAKP
jgi:hypothetical protein